MECTADFLPVHEYAGLHDEALRESVSKSGRKYAMVYRIIVTLGVCFGIIGLFGWEKQQSDVEDLQAQAMDVAKEMKKMMASPQHMAEAKIAAKMLSSIPPLADVDLDFQAQAMLIAKSVEELMADPNFVKQANYVAAYFKALMDTPVVQKEAEDFSEQMKTVVASLRAPESNSEGRRLSSASPAGQLSRPLVGSRPKVFALRQLPLAKRDVSMSAEVQKNLPVLKQVGEARLATNLAKLGLLSAAEKAGVFSTLEKAGAFSTTESLLPLIDNLGLLQKLQGAVDNDSGETARNGAALIALGPLYLVLVLAQALPAPEGAAVAAPALLFTGTTGAGVVLLVLANLVGKLQNAKDGEYNPYD